jgi:hypothetical protein
MDNWQCSGSTIYKIQNFDYSRTTVSCVTFGSSIYVYTLKCSDTKWLTKSIWNDSLIIKQIVKLSAQNASALFGNSGVEVYMAWILMVFQK